MPDTITSQIAGVIAAAFDQYLHNFAALSQEASDAFDRQDWMAIQALQRRRLHLYSPAVSQVAGRISRQPDFPVDLVFWQEVRTAYADLISDHLAREIATTFFNSVVRQLHPGLGADEAAMFVLAPQRDERRSPDFALRFYPSGDWCTLFGQILRTFSRKAPFEDMARDISWLDRRLLEDAPDWYHDPGTWVEMAPFPFFRNRAAYIVGRLCSGNGIRPLLIPLLLEDNGLFADTLITDPDEMALVFSVTRSYFLTEVQSPAAMVRFLQEAMPHKPVSDIYDSLGFDRHGKTELYRDFLNHLTHSSDLITVAPGTRGLVMAVFNLPSYPLVFKLIKDQFEPPKKTDVAFVRAQYRLVSNHERVGRMADTHEFQFFSFPLHRFDPELLAELKAKASSLIKIEGDKLIIRHLYTERRMVPLNLYLARCNPEELEEAAEEYAQCITQLAYANIFPGDMLLKNFGVTRQNRVVFYDYDEIGFLVDYNFRKLPPRETIQDQYEAEPWYGVGPKDVFPEEFRHFLAGQEDLGKLLLRDHSNLFTAEFWTNTQQMIRKGKWLDTFPYRRKKRFKEVYLLENKDTGTLA